jgi:hypothetical protein
VLQQDRNVRVETKVEMSGARDEWRGARMPAD